MNAYDRFALAAASSATREQDRRASQWRRHHDLETGLSFEIPFDLRPAKAESPFDIVYEGHQGLPYVLDVAFMSSPLTPDTTPDGLAREMAIAWMVDQTVVSGPTIFPAHYTGVNEAASLSAQVDGEGGAIAHSWLILRKGNRVGCLSVSCWTAEHQGRLAYLRVLESVRGS